MKYLLIITLALSCCAASGGYRVSPIELQKDSYSHGENVTIDDIRDVVLGLLKRLGKTQDMYSHLMGEWDYEFVDHYLILEDPATATVVVADGYTDREKKQIMVYLWQPCLAASSLIHELVHAIGYDEDDLLMKENIKNIYREMVTELCGEDYRANIPPQPPQDMFVKIQKRQKVLERRNFFGNLFK